MRGLRKGKKYEAGRGASSLNSHAPNEEQADRLGPGVCHCMEPPHMENGTDPLYRRRQGRTQPEALAHPPPVTTGPPPSTLQPLIKWSHDGLWVGWFLETESPPLL